MKSNERDSKQGTYAARAIGWRLLKDNAWWALVQTWGISRSLFGALLATSTAASLIPAALTVVIGLLVNELKVAIDTREPDLAQTFTWLGLAAALILVGNVCNIINQYCRLRLTDELRLAMATKSFEHANSLDLSFFEDSSSLDILSRATQNPGWDFLNFVLDLLTTLEATIQMCSLVGVLFWVDPLTTPLLALPAVPWFWFRWRIAKARYETERLKTTKQRWTTYYLGRLVSREAIPIIKLLRLSPFLLRRFETTMREIMAIDREIYRRQAVGGLAASALFTIGFLLVIILVGYRAVDGIFPFHLLVTYLLAAFRLRSSVNEFINKLSVTMERVLRITNLQEFFKVRPAITDLSHSQTIQIQGAIEFKEVSFSYPGTDRPVLNEISFRIEPGESVALVGPNGGGKTTLVKLLTRLYEPDRGMILIDGRNIREITLDSLHSQIGYIDQNNVRFEATVHENIAYGDWKRLIEQKEAVADLARRANLETMIRKMPDGLDTMLGRLFGNYDLSGGQWQKIAIARAIASNASIYILDEPTAHLDAQSEFEIFESLRDLVRGKTTVLISHRFTSARMADRIMVLDEGRIVEQGSHETLISLAGVYRALYQLHQSSFRLTEDPDIGQ